jgi:transcription initiation factor TFIIIB Brf1 subunit/transcription initiation factor TFIIB
MKLQQQEQEEYIQNTKIGSILLSNLCNALTSAASDSTKHSNISIVTEDSMPATKRIKTEYGSVTPDVDASTDAQNSSDAYHIMDTSFSKGNDITYIPGAILARLSIGGLINALAGQMGGIVNVNTAQPLDNLDKNAFIPTAGDANFTFLQNKALLLSHIISARLQVDMMESTPDRIRDMLCPEVTMEDIYRIRKRIYETVLLGKGTGGSDRAASWERDDLPVAARAALHDIDKFQKCKVCGNNNQSNFVLDKKNGDLICTECGTVNKESLMHEGNAFRKFEGEEDKNHHGDVANPLMSNAYNMGTSLSGVTASVGAGIGGIGSSSRQGLETILKNIHNYTEMNISQFGKDEKKTRIGYKDKQKKEAFYQMAHVADALNLHQAVLQRAKELFAGFRDDRELVQQFKGVLAACLCESFDQLSKDGKQLLKTKSGSDKSLLGAESEQVSNSRATRRNELHSSSLAGKGGLFLNSEGGKKMEHATVKEEGPISDYEKKSASSWDIDDVRSFLLDASKLIAKQRYAKSAETNEASKSLAELEGTLVQNALSLCSVLEDEINGGKQQNGLNRQKVATARVNDMGSLNIRWQHSHERGSGGAGGVGNNGIIRPSKPSTSNGKRSPGQILILKTSKKLGEAMGDKDVGEAFHTEIRRLLSRQELRKKKDLRDIASSQRLNQMKRKPWLQARVQSSES